MCGSVGPLRRLFAGLHRPCWKPFSMAWVYRCHKLGTQTNNSCICWGHMLPHKLPATQILPTTSSSLCVPDCGQAATEQRAYLTYSPVNIASSEQVRYKACDSLHFRMLCCCVTAIKLKYQNTASPLDQTDSACPQEGSRVISRTLGHPAYHHTCLAAQTHWSSCGPGRAL